MSFTELCGVFDAPRIVGLSAIAVIGIFLTALMFAQRSFIFKCLGWGTLVCTLMLFAGDFFELPALMFASCFIFIVLITIYQQELRELVIKITGTRTFTPKKNSSTADTISEMIDVVAQTAVEFSREKTGALMIVERRVKLDDVARSGVEIDAKATPYLLRNIFFDKAPLHDGAVLIRNARIASASCILPLTAKTDIDPDLGTRHRAAIGMSEVSDAIIVVVSEETGVISVAYKSELTRDYSFQALHAFLEKNMHISPENASDKR